MKLYVFFFLAVLLSEALGMSLRHKRQSDDEDNLGSDENNLDDTYSWDWNDNNDSNQNNRGQPQPTPVTTRQIRVTTQSLSVDACIRACPVTPEYNPVCGTNLVQYSNPGRLVCARSCGVNVTLLRASRCPTATSAPA
ncbi:uncharacterized protein LOC126371422 [Pectinophora gossypiella]|uniref:uncharacterized protein LOC126371422 n=1 Tax=Pectinophora gossypiella TaxID=13191 RepID=UPI00214EE6CA|nr:uncharacterized protein LOC126371422 [Pectinophora gossypiella]